MIRGVLLLIIAIGIITALSVLGIRHKKAESLVCEGCSIVLISLDALSAKHSSVYTPNLATTPFMQELATRAIVFQNAYAQSSWTLPSHAAMLSGQYPWDIGIWEGTDRLSESVYTLSEALQAQGYITAAFSEGAYIEQFHGFNQGFQTFVDSTTLSDTGDSSVLFSKAAGWLETQSTEKPFFLFLHVTDINIPYDLSNGTETIRVEDIIAANADQNDIPPEDVARFRDAYYEEIKGVDAALSRFVQSLKDQHRIDSTIIVITSGHGQEFNEHGTVGLSSFTLYDEVTHVPLLFFLPQETAMTIKTPVEIRSVPSTLFQMLSLPSENSFAGKSLQPLMMDDTQRWEPVRARTIFERDQVLLALERLYQSFVQQGVSSANFRERTQEYRGTYTESAILGNWHALRTPDGVVALYQLPNETENVMEKLLYLPSSEQEDARRALKAIHYP